MWPSSPMPRDVVGAGLVECPAHGHDRVRPPRLGVLLGAVGLGHLHGDLARARARAPPPASSMTTALTAGGAQVDAQQCHGVDANRPADPRGGGHAPRRREPCPVASRKMSRLTTSSTSRQAPGLWRSAELGIDGDEVGLLARLERADGPVQAQRLRATERAQSQPIERTRAPAPHRRRSWHASCAGRSPGASA